LRPLQLNPERAPATFDGESRDYGSAQRTQQRLDFSSEHGRPDRMCTSAGNHAHDRHTVVSSIAQPVLGTATRRVRGLAVEI
jgi:hypothetical protein